MLPDLCHHSFWKSSPKIGGPTGFDRCVYVNWPENRGKGPRTDERGAWFPFGCKKGLASCQILLISLDQSINFYLCWSAVSHPEAFQSTLHNQSKNQQIAPEQAWSDGKTPPVGTNSVQCLESGVIQALQREKVREADGPRWVVVGVHPKNRWN